MSQVQAVAVGIKRAVRARRARGRQGAGPCHRSAVSAGCVDRGSGAHGESGLLSDAGCPVAGRPCVRSAGWPGVAPGRDRQRERRSSALGRPNPVGQTLDWNGRPHEVVGVVGDIRGASGRGPTGGGLDREPSSRRLPVRDAVPAEDDDGAGADCRRAVRDRTGDCSSRTRISIRHSRSISSAGCTTGSTRVQRSLGSPRR